MTGRRTLVLLCLCLLLCPAVLAQGRGTISALEAFVKDSEPGGERPTPEELKRLLLQAEKYADAQTYAVAESLLEQVRQRRQELSPADRQRLQRIEARQETLLQARVERLLEVRRDAGEGDGRQSFDLKTLMRKEAARDFLTAASRCDLTDADGRVRCRRFADHAKTLDPKAPVADSLLAALEWRAVHVRVLGNAGAVQAEWADTAPVDAMRFAAGALERKRPLAARTLVRAAARRRAELDAPRSAHLEQLAAQIAARTESQLDAAAGGVPARRIEEAWRRLAVRQLVNEGNFLLYEKRALPAAGICYRAALEEDAGCRSAQVALRVARLLAERPQSPEVQVVTEQQASEASAEPVPEAAVVAAEQPKATEAASVVSVEEKPKQAVSAGAPRAAAPRRPTVAPMSTLELAQHFAARGWLAAAEAYARQADAEELTQEERRALTELTVSLKELTEDRRQELLLLEVDRQLSHMESSGRRAAPVALTAGGMKELAAQRAGLDFLMAGVFLLYRRHEEASALRCFAEAVRLNPQLTEALACLRVARALRGDRRQSAAAETRMLAVRLRYNVRQLTSCVARLRQCIEEKKHDEASQMHARAMIYLKYLDMLTRTAAEKLSSHDLDRLELIAEARREVAQQRQLLLGLNATVRKAERATPDEGLQNAGKKS